MECYIFNTPPIVYPYKFVYGRNSVSHNKGVTVSDKKPNRYISANARVRAEKGIEAAKRHATISRNAQDATLTAIIGTTYVAGVYAKTFVTTHVASRKEVVAEA